MIRANYISNLTSVPVHCPMAHSASVGGDRRLRSYAVWGLAGLVRRGTSLGRCRWWVVLVGAAGPGSRYPVGAPRVAMAVPHAPIKHS